MCNSVRWLSRARSLERFMNCVEEICLVLDSSNRDDFKELYDTQWLTKINAFYGHNVTFK